MPRAIYEDLLESSGGFGRYQCFLLSWLICVCIALGCQHGFMVFGGLHVNKKPGDVDKGPFVFRSIVDEFGLYGMPRSVAAITALQQLGMTFGSIAAGPFSDRQGRRKIFPPVFGAFCVSVITSGMCRDYATFALMRFVIGFFDGANIAIAIVLASEMIPSRFRTVVNSISWPIGYICGVIIAKVTQDWQLFTWFSLLPAPIVFAMLPWLQESPKLLIEQNKIDEAKNVFKEVAAWNNREHSSKNQELFLELENTPRSQVAAKDVSIMILTKDRLLMKRFTVIAYGWFITALNYFSMLLNISNLSGDPGFNLTCVMMWRCGCGLLVTYLDYKYSSFGRKTCTVIALSCVLFCYIGIIFLTFTGLSELYGGTLIILSLIGTGTATIVFTMLTLFVVELLPTVLRNKGTGIMLCISHLGAVIAPSVFLLSSVGKTIPYALLMPTVIVALVGTVKILPETKNQPLPDLAAFLGNGISTSKRIDL